MTDEQAIKLLKLAQTNQDTEHAHSQADRVLVLVLESLGKVAIVEEWKKVRKWYA